MPRGGKRPGAGAPKGNLNALTRGEHSNIAIRVRDYVQEHPHQRRLAFELRDAGLVALTVEPGTSVVTGFTAPMGVYGFLAYMYRHMIDFPHQSNINQTAPKCPRCTPPNKPP